MKLDIHFFKKLYECEKRITVATLVTMLRIVLTPVIIYYLYAQQLAAAFVVFLIAALTDTIDGNLARAWNDKTVLGACLDPLADKIFLVGTFIALALVQTQLYVVPPWFVLLVIVREFIVLLGAFMLLNLGTGFVISPTILSKLTTVIQISFIVWLFVSYFFVMSSPYILTILIKCAAILVIVSCVQYMYIGARYFIGLMVKS